MQTLTAAALAIAVLAAKIATAQTVQPPTNRPTSSIGYSSVAAALESVRTKPGVSVSVQSGWTVIEDRTNLTIWSFTPSNHPAHPAAFRRTITEKDGAFFVQTDGLCEATKPACDKLMAEFQELNDKVRDALSKKR